jgi:protein-arginine kinase activator protein McsA
MSQCFLCGSDQPDTFFQDADYEIADFHTSFSACSTCLQEAGFNPSEKESLFLLFGRSRDSKENCANSGAKTIEHTCEQACPHCGTGIANIATTQVVGCEKCYEAYRAFLKEYLQIRRADAVDQAVENALDQLNQAIEAENYERAAELRDIIEKLEADGE